MNGSSADLDRLRRREPVHDDTTPPAPAPAQRQTSQQHDARLGDVIDRLPDPSAHLMLDFAVVAHAQAVTPPDPKAVKDAEVRARMDQCVKDASGPYTLPGSPPVTVSAPPMFRMPAHEIEPEDKAELRRIAKRAGINENDLFAFKMGQPTSIASLKKMTPALIAAGKLPTTPSDPAKAIKTMQWKYGLGLDCAAYSKAALVAAHGARFHFLGPGMEGFRDLDTKRSDQFARVKLANARPGDLFTLDPGKGETYGHNVVVYDNKVVDDAKRAELVAKLGPNVAPFLDAEGTKRVLVVDSSWGAGVNGSLKGGYRRDTWIYNEKTKEWASFTPGTSPLRVVISADGPSGDRYKGVYRPR